MYMIGLSDKIISKYIAILFGYAKYVFLEYLNYVKFVIESYIKKLLHS